MKVNPAEISAFAVYSKNPKFNGGITKSKQTSRKFTKKHSIMKPVKSDKSPPKKTVQFTEPALNSPKVQKSSTLSASSSGDDQVVNRQKIHQKKLKKILSLQSEKLLINMNKGPETSKTKSQRKKRREKAAKTSILPNKPSSPKEKKIKKSRPSNGSNVSPLNISQSEDLDDSRNIGEKAFSWLIDPVCPEQFCRESWEKRPVHVKRHAPEYYTSILTTGGIDQMLRRNNLHFTRNLDITTYVDGKRETLNPGGRALPAMVWDYYTNGCSVRLLNPQTYCRKLHKLNAMLQEYFGSFVGANAYLTPPDSQGFAPHYDDIEAFILQVEGKKHWKLYAPRTSNEILPRYSSENFTEDDLPPPIMDVVLEAGDLLYFPRGTIHQARCASGEHSLHITLSVYQKTSWADLLEQMIPAALKIAIDTNPQYREGLPLNYLNYMGVVHSETNSEMRTQFFHKLEGLLNNLFHYAPVDGAIDQMGKRYQHDALPPTLTNMEKERMVFGEVLKMEDGAKLVKKVQIMLSSKIRLIRRLILRLVMEEDVVRIYHSIDNSKDYHGEEEQYLEIDSIIAPAIEVLVQRYPEFTTVADLPIDDESGRLQIASDLWERGLLMTEEPLQEI